MKNTIEKLKKYFSIKELVDREVYAIHGERAWKFFDENALLCLLAVREGLNKPITINDWSWGGSMQQRGLRHNKSDLVLRKSGIYLSAHMMGRAFDFDVEGMTAVEVREWIVENPHIFPCKIRLERKIGSKPISWVHLDNFFEEKNPKVYEFDI